MAKISGADEFLNKEYFGYETENDHTIYFYNSPEKHREEICAYTY